jgi:hypothetical protein
MKFRITRTSVCDNVKPCEKAVKGKYLYICTRTYTEEEFNKRFAHRDGLWRSKGINHRVNKDGNIQRDDERECFIIEFNTLEELVQFVETNGDIVVSTLDSNIPTIEIYDGYRE